MNHLTNAQEHDFATKCIQSFGMMNKTDYETLLFYELLQANPYASDLDFCRELKIPVAKVRRLRYLADLRYASHDEAYYQTRFTSLIINNTDFDPNGKEVRMQIVDEATRDYLSDLLLQNGIVSDTSFNKEIIKIKADDFFTLFTKIYHNEEAIKQLQKKEHDTEEWSKWLVLFIGDIVRGTTRSEILSELSKKATEAVTKWLKEKFSKNNKQQTNKQNN